jgi:group I intron endonuclease
MFGYIYKTTNLLNGKTYIGKKYGCFDHNYYGSGMILKQAIEKYGKNNFEITILAECDCEDTLNNTEKLFIANGTDYNIAEGGAGGNTLAMASSEYKEEVIRKRSKGLSDNWKSLTEEERKQRGRAISEAKKGKSFGGVQQHTEESKKRISESNKIAARNRSETWKKNHAIASAKRRGISNVKCQTPVSIDGVIYEGVIIAANKLGVSRKTINNWIKKGKAKYETT